MGEAGRLWLPLETAAIPASSRFLGAWYTTILIDTKLNEKSNILKISIYISNSMDSTSGLVLETHLDQSVVAGISLSLIPVQHYSCISVISVAKNVHIK